MGATIFFGYNTKAGKKEDVGLVITLGSSSSGCFERLIDEALSENFPDILEKIREYDVLAQLHFTELNQAEFYTAVQAIRDYLNKPLVDEWQIYVKELWYEKFEPMFLIDDRHIAV